MGKRKRNLQSTSSSCSWSPSAMNPSAMNQAPAVMTTSSSKMDTEENRQPVKLRASLATLHNLNLSEEKKDLMRDSVFSHVTKIQNDKQSSTSLIKLFSDFYDPTTRRFVLNNNTSFSFCAKEVADVLGLENTGLSLSTPAAKRVPKFVYDLMKECDLGREISTVTIKKLLSQMDVNDEESKLNFKKLFCYFLIEMFFIPSLDPKKPRTAAWAMVEDLDIYEKVNWAEAIYDDLHVSFNKLKNEIKTRFAKQHNFKGCAPVFEAVVFERIPSLKPNLSSFHYPPIQKYDYKRSDWEVLKTIKADEITPCSYCGDVAENFLASGAESDLAEDSSLEDSSLVSAFVDICIDDADSQPSLPMNDAQPSAPVNDDAQPPSPPPLRRSLRRRK